MPTNDVDDDDAMPVILWHIAFEMQMSHYIVVDKTVYWIESILRTTLRLSLFMGSFNTTTHATLYRVREQYEVTLSVHMLRGPILDHYVNISSLIVSPSLSIRTPQLKSTLNIEH
ncbi:hypothetical protein BLOT_004252 [Blomia tropicalis]|nr:hypothetical protein BLOT_004252 [Blomia tropicalis]